LKKSAARGSRQRARGLRNCPRGDHCGAGKIVQKGMRSLLGKALAVEKKI